MVKSNAAIAGIDEYDISSGLQLTLLKEEKVSSPFALFCEAIEFHKAPSGAWVDCFGSSLRKWCLDNLPRKVKVLSLFSGAGGLDIGFHDAGFDVVEMVEIDHRFCETLKHNTGNEKYLGNSSVICEDIRSYSAEKLKDVEFIIGGPPCQTFSAAGRRAAGVRGTQDERGSLFEEYVRILKEIKPKGFLFENVYGITGAEGGEAWKRITAAFSEAGYNISYRLLDSADFGVPQHRERMFIVGVRDGVSYAFPKPTHGPDSPNRAHFYNAGEALCNVRNSVIPADGLTGRYGHLLNEIPPGLNYSFFTEKMGHPKPLFAWRSKFSDFLYKADPEVPTRTLKAQGGQYTGPFHWDNRPFTADELKRLQTFPDAYNLVGNRTVAYHQIGNSVPPQLARILAISIMDQVFECDFPIELPTLKSQDELGFRKRKRLLTKRYADKAERAIQHIKEDASLEVLSQDREYSAYLGKDLSWLECENGANFEVAAICREEKWEISIKPRKGVSSEESFSIEIKPRKKGSWPLESSNVVLKSFSDDDRSFTAVWKAFEKELSDRHIKADLVQLSGYYQYVASFHSDLSAGIQGEKIFGGRYQSLKLIQAGVGVGEILLEEELSERLCVTSETFIEFAEWLKYLGYEVRNNKTNPQIKSGHFLIPYSFPTLSALSVQRKKKLR